jgi:hypothetical protein
MQLGQGRRPNVVSDHGAFRSDETGELEGLSARAGTRIEPLFSLLWAGLVKDPLGPNVLDL